MAIPSRTLSRGTNSLGSAADPRDLASGNRQRRTDATPAATDPRQKNRPGPGRPGKLGQATRPQVFEGQVQCLNIAQPLGQGLWEGVRSARSWKLVGRINIRRVYYWGFHNNDPKQLFNPRWAGYNQVMAQTLAVGPGAVRRLPAERCAPISLLRGGLGADDCALGRTASNPSNGCSASS